MFDGERGGIMEKILVTIGRQYGSGGRMIGRQIAENLGISFYDRELIELASQKSGIEVGTLSMFNERAVPATLLKMKSRGAGKDVGDILFQTQTQIIREIAEKESCVIIGRCGDYVLQDFPQLFSVFVTAPIPKRVQRIMERNHMSEEDARAAVDKVDRQRRDYYNHYTGKSWGGPESYQLTVDSSVLGIEGTVRALEEKIGFRIKNKEYVL